MGGFMACPWTNHPIRWCFSSSDNKPNSTTKQKQSDRNTVDEWWRLLLRYDDMILLIGWQRDFFNHWFVLLFSVRLLLILCNEWNGKNGGSNVTIQSFWIDPCFLPLCVHGKRSPEIEKARRHCIFCNDSDVRDSTRRETWSTVLCPTLLPVVQRVAS